MNKKANQSLNKFVECNLSLDQEEISWISDKYNFLKNCLEGYEIFQSGSYARGTSLSPVDDLDIIWVLPKSYRKRHRKEIELRSLDPDDILEELANQLRNDYGAEDIKVEIIVQNHSVGIYFEEEDFSIDIVPAIPHQENNFGQDMYLVPEGGTGWIESDPRGYIKANKILSDKNNSFQLAVKFVKYWKKNCKLKYPFLPLKSFHLEQIIYRLFVDNLSLNTLSAINNFYEILPEYLTEPQIPDRANPNSYIDDYVSDIGKHEKIEVEELCKVSLRWLEKFKESLSEESLYHLYMGLDKEEEFIENISLDKNIEDKDLFVRGKVLETDDGQYDAYWLHERDAVVYGIDITRKIKFSAKHKNKISDNANLKWKVKNRPLKEGGQLRGRLNNLKDPEVTSFQGHHFVECFAIKDDVCIGYGRQYVHIKQG